MAFNERKLKNMDIRIYIDDKRPVHKCRAVDTLEPGELEFVCTYPGCNYSRLFRADGSTVVINPDDSVIHTGASTPDSIDFNN